MATKKKTKRPERVVVYASLTPADGARLDAFGEKESARTGAKTPRGTSAVQLIRLGLAAAEAS